MSLPAPICLLPSSCFLLSSHCSLSASHSFSCFLALLSGTLSSSSYLCLHLLIAHSVLSSITLSGLPPFHPSPPKPLIHSPLLKVKHSSSHCFSMRDTSVMHVSLSYSSHLSLLSSFSDSHPHVTPSNLPRSCRMTSISVIVRHALSCTIHFDFPLMSSF